MGTFDDQRLLEIFLYGLTAGVSPQDCATIRRKLVIFRAIRSWTTVGIVGEVFLVEGGRLAVMATDDWGISFEWWEGQGASMMRLEP
ncbi:MAG: hypothetical protein E6G94_00040 [Alphaproteobacteria bacterium]|nr:MAG: hypothetical protein E6G94_00040 [Alphaproteobacteria bacterium]